MAVQRLPGTPNSMNQQITTRSVVWLVLFCLIVLVTIATTSQDTSGLEDASASDQQRPAQPISGFNLFGPNVTAQGVEQLSPYGYKLTSSFQGVSLPSMKSSILLDAFRGDFTLVISALLSDQSKGTLLHISKHSKAVPFLDLTMDVPESILVLRYLGAKSFQRVTLASVFPDKKWMHLYISVHGKEFSASVDCGPKTSSDLRQVVGAVPSDSTVVFGGDGTSNISLQGVVFEAKLYPGAYNMDQSHCRSLSERPLGDQPFDAHDDPLSGGECLALGGKVNSLEQQVAQLTYLVETLQSENSELRQRVSQLETCECYPSCNFNGTVYNEGDTWAPDQCTLCQCQNSRPACQPRFDLPECAEPCLSNPCHNNGECLSAGELDLASYQCQCPPPFDGDTCEVRQNPCVWPPQVGSCDQQIVRYYYDKLSQNCLPFMYSGCGGNVNNYHTLEECTTIALHGACCHRNYSTAIQDVERSTQELEINCQELHLVQCRALHRQPSGDLTETEVISFNPGLTCREATCQTVGMCVVGQRVYQEGETVKLGCQECRCKAMGQVQCECKRLSVRKDVRDMTRAEMARFQAAVAKLRESEDRTWEQFRDLHMYHVMHASGGTFFLPWHRVFLRQLEQRLQEIDCNIVLPYFDFTTDIGFFEEAIIWQPNYFGGNGDGSCVEHHQFGPKTIWQPCIVRNFNTSIILPNKVELLLALASEDYEEMSLCLETYVAYLHNFIGGDMMTSSSPYDPVFYAIHAYIDMLYWTWQQRGNNKYKFPAAFGNIPMIPFNIPPWAVFDSEENLCVTYALPSKGHPCNSTQISTPRPRPRPRAGSKRGDIDPMSAYGPDGFDQLGYSQEGFDKRDFDPYGYGRNGYNRDGYNKEGYDIGGFNRYGFNVEGYDRYGFNDLGFDKDGNPDDTNRFDRNGYDVDCLNRQGLTKHGLDQYGFYKNATDLDGCTYLFHGPFATIQSWRLHTILSIQPKAFLMSIARTCPGLSALPANWLDLNWVARTKDVTAMVPVALPDMQTSTSGRFCFDTRSFLTSCVCENGPAICQTNPCAGQSCQAFPEATCRINFCGECTARWFFRGREVSCEKDRDYCSPSPCEHGGTCVQSIWSGEPHLVTCLCPPGYQGHLCQHRVQEVCSLPLRTGNCNSPESRWYFDQRSGRCERFTYTGCQGNANNFPSLVDCQTQCIKGACCSREPKIRARNVTIGFDLEGYDKYGFNAEGYNRFGDRRTTVNSFALSIERFDANGFDWQGYDMEGFDKEGFNRAGLNRQGFDEEGFNITGYSRGGEYDGIIDYDEEGFDPEGYNRVGLSCHGNDRQGLDLFGTVGEYKYSCEVTTLGQCQELARAGAEVVKFTPGKTCEESGCGLPCGCRHGNQTFKLYETFKLGCQTCTCNERGAVMCVCDFGVKRKEIREMSKDEMTRYQLAIRTLSQDSGYPSQWFDLASLYSSHKPQSSGTPLFLPWHRQFLRHMEKMLQNIDCGIAIPYYDWTVDAGTPQRSLIWAADVMGGNGGPNGCVRYHPFKSYHPPYLSPCLRRDFNTSISLPSVVNVEMALRETDYNHFRLHMEMFARLYQSFVGGHMASDLAPYDPLFYSLMAMIDKLWTQWQDRHPQSMLTFPLNVRYARLDPFKVSADDVFDSRIQLCVDYLPFTEGVPCNVTEIKTFGYNQQGYDRHGYNREGYDRDGFNVEGYDSAGNFDDRQIYNIHGFDKHGFRRTGFDSSGIDRYGFNEDSYNLDDFDAQGYDRSGYNRYGFNQQGLTPYGYHINGSYLQNINVSELGIFDPFGYNKYGYSNQGFDRNGFDIFGFDYRGYDTRICNKYYLGPIHILVKRYISTALADLNVTVLTGLKRICPQLSELPDHVRRQFWLDRHGQDEILDFLYDHQTQRHMIDNSYMPRETSLTPDLIWLPIAPDERLCLVTEVYTNCRLGEPQLMCPSDLCEGRVCPGHDSAVCRIQSCGVCRHEWYDGLTGRPLECSGCVDRTGQERQELETWSERPCETCVCLDGVIHCDPLQCEAPACTHPIQSPGRCCPSCEGCFYKGEIVLSGSYFNIPDDPCSRCYCENGNVACTKVKCPALGECVNVIHNEDQCCPVCQDCGRYLNGQTWKQSSCQECTCQGGQVNCNQIICSVPDCEHPFTPQGECCPQCSSCLYEDRVYRDGQMFSPDPCSTCICSAGTMRCETVQCPMVTCQNPVTPRGLCCPACDLDCEYSGRTYRHDTDFTPEYNPCLNCSCSNSIVRCRTMHCSQLDLTCESPIRRPGECCPSICPACEDNGIDYHEGDTWPSHNSACDVCECRSGKVLCQPRTNCPRRCTHGVIRPSECCSQCIDCLFEGRVVARGETITLPGNICRQCTCQDGNMDCRNIIVSSMCPRLNCQRTETLPGQCCPVCAGCVFNGERFDHGDIVSQDQCSTCTCEQGEVICDDPTKDCPPLACPMPKQVEGQCCPVCDTCVHYGREYRNGESFTSQRDPCQRCVCQSGLVNCQLVDQECPRLPCTHPARERGQCCPTCDSCMYRRRLMRNGQRFPAADPCEMCVCQRGSVVCSKVDCPEVRCANTVTVPGRCCPKCDETCVFDGNNYREGETFKSPGNQCTICACKNGQVSCEDPSCPPAACSHPALLPGECCPECNFCFYEKRIFRNQQRFVHPRDSCQTCSCEFGSVTCTSVICEDLTCSNPMPMAGSCCPVCPKQCSYQGYTYDDAETFVNPRDKCEDCLCRQGQVHCKRRMCPRVNCANPIQDGCCPICTDCSFHGKILKQGESVPDPDDQCQSCECLGGSVRCRSVTCPRAACSHPIRDGCCFSCRQCMYRGKMYNNGEVVPEGDRCRTCICVEGNVECQTNPCPAVTCAHPAPSGQCCPECRDCLYQGRNYRDGQIFPDANSSCKECVCGAGTVTCSSKTCPAVTCTHPVQGRCCEECNNCFFNGRTIREGTYVPDPNDSCQECLCRQGSISCVRKTCQAGHRCRHPVQRGCCEECTDCLYEGREYRNGQEFADPAIGCIICRCSYGDVTCQQQSCPSVTCTHPVQGECCPECHSGCYFQGRTYRSGQRMAHPTDQCQQCACSAGNVRCSPVDCSAVSTCTHPVKIDGECCPVCGRDCLYEGQIVRNGNQFERNCQTCTCLGGSVQCTPRQCPALTCTHPVVEGCCQVCSDCTQNGLRYRNGQAFTHPRDSCQQCLCQDGSVLCDTRPCPEARCSHPIRQGCCLECTDCDYNGRRLTSGQRFPDQSDPCSECLCQSGSVRCSRKQCPPVSCDHPDQDRCGCPECAECVYGGRRMGQGQRFPSLDDPCKECQCREGTVRCETQACPEARCSHPVKQGCCPECSDCNFNGLIWRNGLRFPDPSDPCKECSCQSGSVRCSQKQCPPATCNHPGQDSCGCPVCSLCVYQGRQVSQGERFPSIQDPCQECECRSGSVSCQAKQCPFTCSHPVSVSGCCPKCDSCLYDDRVWEDGQGFLSSQDPCQMCQCLRGSVRCQTMTCPQTECLNPMKMEGECCPSCPLCMFLGETYTDNQRFPHPKELCQVCECKMGRVECAEEQCVAECTHPRRDQCCPVCDSCLFEDELYENGQTFQPDACRTCSCSNGNVVCDEQTCPTLPCVQVKKVEGLCCDVCQGCTFKGILYDDGASWVMQDNSCVTCTCHSGFVTCMEMDCFTPCPNPVAVPGQCCPVCPTCNFDGHMYADGDEFTPNGDPCDLCHCVEGTMSCLHNTCPSVANCPSGSLREPAPGSCCPTCVESFSTGCSEAEFGKINRPRPEDPCFFCECKEDFNWVCMKEECPALTCPPDVQVYSPSQCCPSCPACYDLSSATYHHEGSEWSAVEDPCITCACKSGTVQCSMRECPAVSCSSNERVTIPQGQCCEMCQPVADASCYHQQKTYKPGDEWTVDECTTCKCQGGEVTCNVKQCPSMDCAQDEAPVTTPGRCCPVCKKRPGTCLVFGDPHYRSFDGATLHFQGTCRYIMAADCDTDLFRVEVQHDSRGVPGDVAWAQNLTVTVAGAVVDLMQGRKVQVNGQPTDLPFLYEPHILIEESSKTLLLSTAIGLRVLWDGSSYGEITVPGSFKRQLCGLCGNFNGFPQDDLRTRSGQITNSPATFGNSWKSKTQLSENCRDAVDIDPCMAAGYRMRKLATSKCAILKGKPFTRCHKVVSPEPFFSSCVYDMCVCMDQESCLCDIVATYAHECARHGVRVEWRSQNLCAFDCDASVGLIFDECGPVCPRTCNSQHSSQANQTELCFKPCVASCQCTADKVLHEGRCISPSECPYVRTTPTL